VTLSSQKTTGKSVFFSVGALTSTGSSKYFYMAGSGTNLERINLSDESVQTMTVSASDGSTTRSLAADSCGNVVSGHKSGADLYFQYSSDSGSSFSAQQLVIASADRANASINPTNGDLMFLYEKSGDIFLTTYAGLFVNGSNCYAATISNTAIEFTAPGQTPSITLTNTSNSPLSVDNISITGNVFTVSHNCGSFIPANGSCTVLINGSSQGNETLNITLNGTQRTIPVTLGATAAARPPEESTPPVAAPVQENNNSITEEVIAIEETNLEVVVPNNKIVRNDKLENKKDSLPNTGSESSGILIFSLILILLGSIFVAGKKISKPLL
jgi:LPXTG-motif cell wall-anchored protein